MKPAANLPEKLIAHFAAKAFAQPDLPLICETAPFHELAGQDLASRLLEINGSESAKHCLRPEFTIPICEYDIARRKSEADKKDRHHYAYCGPVFRHRGDGPAEFIQAGLEIIGDGDEAEVDVFCVKEALDALDACGLEEMTIITGDSGIFASLLDALEIPALLSKRLINAFGNRQQMSQTLEEARSNASEADHSLSHAFKDLRDQDTAERVVEEMIKISGVDLFGGRKVSEIAERFYEKAQLSAGLDDAALALIEEFLTLEMPFARASDGLENFARKSGLDLDAACARQDARFDQLKNAGALIERMQFHCGFGRPLGYYSGFAFEITAGQLGERVIGGGRYDLLLERLGAPQPLPATGFSIWLDALAKAVDQ